MENDSFAMDRVHQGPILKTLEEAAGEVPAKNYAEFFKSS